MKIAIAVDLSVESHFAVHWALDLRDWARKRDRPVDVFAISIPADVQEFEYRNLAGYPTDATEIPGVRHRMTHHVRNFLETVDYDVDDIEIILDEGDASEIITEFCEREGIDWLVTGMDATDALSRMLLGSTVHQLRETAPCNLVVVHPEHARLTGDQNFVTGIDFLPGSESALFAASEISDLTDSHLHLVHALQDAPTGSSRSGPIRSLDPTDVAYLTADARESLEAMMDELQVQYPDIEYSTLVHSGSARRVLIEYIDRHNIDAAFLGKVHHSTFEKWFFGSVSRLLLKRMPTTLVLAPPET